MRSFSVAAILLATVATSSATLVTIDDFSSLPQTLSVNSTGAQASGYATGGSVWGNGSRAITINNVTAPQGRAATFDIDVAAYGSNGFGTKSRMTAWYGAIGVPSVTNGGVTVAPSNGYSLPGLTGFEYSWLGSDKSVVLSTTLASWNGSGFDAKVWRRTIAAGGPQTITFGAADLLIDTGANPNAFAYLTFSVNATGSAATDWGMDKFSAVVPEPASMAVLGVGLAALRRRRRNANRAA